MTEHARLTDEVQRLGARVRSLLSVQEQQRQVIRDLEEELRVQRDATRTRADVRKREEQSLLHFKQEQHAYEQRQQQQMREIQKQQKHNSAAESRVLLLSLQRAQDRLRVLDERNQQLLSDATRDKVNQNTLQDTVTRLAAEMEQRVGQVASLAAERDILASQLARTTSGFDEQSSISVSLQQQLSALQEEHTAVVTRVNALQGEADEKSKKARESVLQVSGLSTSLAGLEEEVIALREQHALLTTSEAETTKRLTAQDRDITGKAEKITALEQQLSNVNARAENAESESKSLHDQVCEKTELLSVLHAEMLAMLARGASKNVAGGAAGDVCSNCGAEGVAADKVTEGLLMAGVVTPEKPKGTGYAVAATAANDDDGDDDGDDGDGVLRSPVQHRRLERHLRRTTASGSGCGAPGMSAAGRVGARANAASDGLTRTFTRTSSRTSETRQVRAACTRPHSAQQDRRRVRHHKSPVATPDRHTRSGGSGISSRGRHLVGSPLERHCEKGGVLVATRTPQKRNGRNRNDNNDVTSRALTAEERALVVATPQQAHGTNEYYQASERLVHGPIQREFGYDSEITRLLQKCATLRQSWLSAQETCRLSQDEYRELAQDYAELQERMGGLETEFQATITEEETRIREADALEAQLREEITDHVERATSLEGELKIAQEKYVSILSKHTGLRLESERRIRELQRDLDRRMREVERSDKLRLESGATAEKKLRQLVAKLKRKHARAVASALADSDAKLTECVAELKQSEVTRVKMQSETDRLKGIIETLEDRMHIRVHGVSIRKALGASDIAYAL